MRKDVIDDRYGRMYEMPFELSRMGINVSCFSLSYISKGSFNKSIFTGLKWTAEDFNAKNPFGLISLLRKINSEIKSIQPVAIIATSDVIHLALAQHISQRENIPLISDLYDNFESYGLSKLPFVNLFYRRALKNSTVVICVSKPLSVHVAQYCDELTRIEVIENAVDKDIFKPLLKGSSRAELNLPGDAILIGTAGALHESRGIEVLYRAFRQIHKENSNVHLVLAGRSSKKVPIPDLNNVHYLGELTHDRVACLYNALDIAIVPLTGTAFGKFCYPQKACEILACKRPLLASSVGIMKDMLIEYPECLFEDGDVGGLVDRIFIQLRSPVTPNVNVHSWKEQSIKMKALISNLESTPRR